MRPRRRNERWIKIGMREWMYAMIEDISERSDVSLNAVVRDALEKAYPEYVQKHRELDARKWSSGDDAFEVSDDIDLGDLD